MTTGETVVSAIHSFISSCSIYSVCCALVAFCFGIALDLQRKTSTSLQGHLVRAIAAGAVPPALVLICGAFDPTIITKAHGLEVPILLGGLSLLYLSLKQTLK